MGDEQAVSDHWRLGRVLDAVVGVLGPVAVGALGAVLTLLIVDLVTGHQLGWTP